MKRRRVDRDVVAKNAQDSKSSGGFNWLRLPKGVKEWKPDKPGSYKLDFLPYVVSTAEHPDRIDKGTIWYKFPFAVHRGLGVNNESAVCPASLGKRCPICEEKGRLAKDWDKNETEVRALNAQKFVAYNIIDPEDSDAVAVFLFSRGKFAEFLENELCEDGNQSNLSFYDVTKDGRTIKVRFTEDEFKKGQFLTATRIDFIPRDEMDEDSVLESVACLDKIVEVQSYEELKKKFLGESESDDEPKKKGRFKGRDEEEEDKDEDTDDEDKDEDTDDEAPPKRKFKFSEEDNDEDEPPKKKKSKKLKKKRDEEEELGYDDEEEEEEEEEEPKPKKKFKRRRDEDEEE